MRSAGDAGFNEADGALGGLGTDEFEAGRFEEYGEFGRGAFLAAGRHDEHFDVEEFRRVGLVGVGDDHLGEEDAAGLGCVGGELIAHQAQDFVGVLVGPVVDDVLHDVGVAACGDAFEHGAGLMGEAGGGSGGVGDDFGKVEEDAVEMGVEREDLG